MTTQEHPSEAGHAPRLERWAVIGSNSFSGSHFVDHLLGQGLDVLGMSRSPEPNPVFLPYKSNSGGRFRFLQLDLNHHLDRVMEALDEFRPEAVVNFAAQGMVAESWARPEDWFNTNTVSMVRLHDQLRRRSWLRRYVHIGTPEVYGSTEGLVDETAPFNPSTPYAVSRAACDLSLRSFLKAYQFPVVWTRAANVYGPGQQLYRILPRTLMFAKLGRRLPLHGGGHSMRSFVHIRDVARGTRLAAELGRPGDVFHFSTDRFVKIRDLVALAAESCGAKFEDVVDISGERLGKDPFYTLDCAKSRRVLGWEPAVPLEAGVDETHGWVEKNFAVLRNESLDYVHKS